MAEARPASEVVVEPAAASNGKKRQKQLAVVADNGTVMPWTEATAMLQMIERLARDSSVDPARIEQLLKLKREEEDRRARVLFQAAFAKLQADLPAVERKGTSHHGKYARFEDFITTIKPHVAKHGFSLWFKHQNEGESIRVFGVLGHEAGHQETTDLLLPPDATGNKNPVQRGGSSIQYGKRYVGMSLLGVATEDEDDDGNMTSAS